MKTLIYSCIEASYFLKMRPEVEQLMRASRKLILFLFLTCAANVALTFFIPIETQNIIFLAMFDLMFLLMMKRDTYTLVADIKNKNILKAVPFSLWITMYFFLTYWEALLKTLDTSAWLICAPSIFFITCGCMFYQDRYPALNHLGQNAQCMQEVLAIINNEESLTDVCSKGYVKLKYFDDYQYLDLRKLAQSNQIKEILNWKNQQEPAIRKLITPFLLDHIPLKQKG